MSIAEQGSPKYIRLAYRVNFAVIIKYAHVGIVAFEHPLIMTF